MSAEEKWLWALFGAFMAISLVAIGEGIADRRNADAATRRMQDSIERLQDAVRQLIPNPPEVKP